MSIKSPILSVLILFPFSLFSQYLLPGLITYQNSGNKPVVGAEVKTVLSNPTLTDDKGLFELDIKGNKEGYVVEVLIKKSGYEVVNRQDLVQTLSRERQRVKYYLCRKGDYDRNALAFYEINIKNLSAKYKKREELIQQRYANQKAILEDSLSYLEKQFRVSKEQVQSLSKQFAMVNLDDVTDLYERAFDSFSNGDFTGAIELLNDISLEEQLVRVNKEFKEGQNLIEIGENKLTTAREAKKQAINTYVLKADLLILDFRFDEVEKYYLKAIEADTMNIDIRFKYAYFLQTRRDFVGAGIEYKKLIALETDSFNIANLLNNLGITQVAQQEYTEGIKNYHKSIRILENYSKIANPSYQMAVAAPYTNLGQTLIEQNSYAKGIESYKTAISILEETIEEGNQQAQKEIAILYNALGMALSDQNYDAEAISYYRKAIKINEKYAELDGRPVLSALSGLANSLGNMGNTYAELQNYKKSDSALTASIEIFRQLADKNPPAFLPNLGNYLMNLGTSKVSNRELKSAGKLLEETLGIYRELVRQNPLAYMPNLALTLDKMARLYDLQNDHKRCLTTYDELIRIWRSLFESNQEVYKDELANCLHNYGIILIGQLDYDRGETAELEALALFRELARANPRVYNSKIGLALHNISTTHWHSLKLSDALGYCGQAEIVYDTLLHISVDKFGLEVARNFLLKGQIQKELEKLEVAQISWQKADSILRLCPDSKEKRRIMKGLQEASQPEAPIDPQDAKGAAQDMLDEIAAIKNPKVRMAKMTQVVNYFEEKYKSEPAREDIRYYLAYYQGTLSWYACLAKSFSKAEKAGYRALELNPKLDFARANLGHSKLLLGHLKEAKSIYLNLPLDTKYNEQLTYRQVLLEDFELMEKAKIVPENYKKDLKKMVKLIEQ